LTRRLAPLSLLRLHQHAEIGGVRNEATFAWFERIDKTFAGKCISVDQRDAAAIECEP
jgi:hypothetical protein